MTDEKPPEGMETKDVHTAAGGTFQGTEQGTPGYHPAAVPNRNQTTINGSETVHEQGLRDQPAAEDGGSGESDTADKGSSSSSKTTTKSTSSRSTSAKS